MFQKQAWILSLSLAAALGLLGDARAVADSSPGALSPPSYQDPDQLQSLISTRSEAYFLVDVRTLQEYEQGHIPTAINIPYDTIAAHPPTPDTSALIIVYCASGKRSAKAKQTLDGLGFLRVVDFGAMSRWKGSSIAGADPGDCPCRVQY